MPIPHQSQPPGAQPELRSTTRRASDVDQQQIVASWGRKAPDGNILTPRNVRLTLAATAVTAITMLVGLLALLIQENANSPHALHVAAASQGAPMSAAFALPEESRPVVIIDEKDEPAARPVVQDTAIPPLVLLPREVADSPPARVAAPAPAARTHANGKLAGAPSRHPSQKAGKRTSRLAANGGTGAAARKAPRKNAPPVSTKRKVSMTAATAPRQQERDADIVSLDAILSYANLKMRRLEQPLPLTRARLNAPRRLTLREP